MKLTIALKSAVDGQVNAERLVNMYAEATGGKSDVEILSVPGLSLFSTTGYGVGRGLFVHDDELYTVVGSSLYKVSVTGTVTEIGNVTGSGIAQGASSGVELCVVCEGTGYIWDGTSYTQITDADFLGANSVTYLDGYFIFGNSTSQFSISALYAGETIDALDFASAESNPDVILRPFVDHRELLLFGKETVETWINTGGSDFPFERVQGGIAEKGIANRNAIAKIDNTVFWLDHNGIVRRMVGGYSPQRISTHEVESTMVDIDEAECFAFIMNGHEFFCLTLPTVTWIYDAATQLWHERKSEAETRWRVRGYAFCYGKHYVGDFENGNIYELTYESFTEAGENILADIVFPAVHNEGQRFRVHRLVLDMEVGEGPAYSEPGIRLDLSEDGADWTTHSYQTLGDTGQRTKRVVWRRLGQHRTLHMRFRISDPCRRAIYAAYAEVQGDS